MSFLKEFLCKHEYKFIDRIQSYYTLDSGKVTIIDTDLLECYHCEKRKIVYSYKYLVSEHLRKYLELWEKKQFMIPKEWFEPLPKIIEQKKGN